MTFNFQWIPELKQHAADKPYILVGCKMDMRVLARRELAMEIVDDYDGMHVSAAIDSQSFFECSAKTLVVEKWKNSIISHFRKI